MCLGAVGEVVAVGAGGEVTVRVEGRDLVVSSLVLDEPVTVGDWVVVHTGYVLAQLREEEAREALRLRDTMKESQS